MSEVHERRKEEAAVAEFYPWAEVLVDQREETFSVVEELQPVVSQHSDEDAEQELEVPTLLYLKQARVYDLRQARVESERLYLVALLATA